MYICILVCILTHEGVCDSWCVDIVDYMYVFIYMLTVYMFRVRGSRRVYIVEYIYMYIYM